MNRRARGNSNRNNRREDESDEHQDRQLENRNDRNEQDDHNRTSKIANNGVLEVTGLVRPWSDEELKNKINEIARQNSINCNIEKYEVNNIRSIATITFSSVRDAETMAPLLDGSYLSEKHAQKPGAKPIKAKFLSENDNNSNQQRGNSTQSSNSKSENQSNRAPRSNDNHRVDQHKSSSRQRFKIFQQDILDYEEQELNSLKKMGFELTKTQPILAFRPNTAANVAGKRRRRGWDFDPLSAPAPKKRKGGRNRSTANESVPPRSPSPGARRSPSPGRYQDDQGSRSPSRSPSRQFDDDRSPSRSPLRSPARSPLPNESMEGTEQ